jgi:hypothetical protein
LVLQASEQLARDQLRVHVAGGALLGLLDIIERT